MSGFLNRLSDSVGWPSRGDWRKRDNWRKRDGSDIVKLGGPADVRAIFNRARHFDFGPPFAGDPWDAEKRDMSNLNWAAPPTSERSSTGRGILISAHPSRATRGTIGRL